jgi:hypothetical protein
VSASGKRCGFNSPRLVSTAAWYSSFVAARSPPMAGLLPYRELDNTLGLTHTGGDTLADARTARTTATDWPACCGNRYSDGSPAMRM